MQAWLTNIILHKGRDKGLFFFFTELESNFNVSWLMIMFAKELWFIIYLFINLLIYSHFLYFVVVSTGFCIYLIAAFVQVEIAFISCGVQTHSLAVH